MNNLKTLHNVLEQVTKIIKILNININIAVEIQDNNGQDL